MNIIKATFNLYNPSCLLKHQDHTSEKPSLKLSQCWIAIVVASGVENVVVAKPDSILHISDSMKFVWMKFGTRLQNWSLYCLINYTTLPVSKITRIAKSVTSRKFMSWVVAMVACDSQAVAVSTWSSQVPILTLWLTLPTDRGVSLGIGGWAVMDHARQITVSTRAWMKSNSAR